MFEIFSPLEATTVVAAKTTVLMAHSNSISIGNISGSTTKILDLANNFVQSTQYNFIQNLKTIFHSQPLLSNDSTIWYEVNSTGHAYYIKFLSLPMIVIDNNNYTTVTLKQHQPSLISSRIQMQEALELIDATIEDVEEIVLAIKIVKEILITVVIEKQSKDMGIDRGVTIENYQAIIFVHHNNNNNNKNYLINSFNTTSTIPITTSTTECYFNSVINGIISFIIFINTATSINNSGSDYLNLAIGTGCRKITSFKVTTPIRVIISTKTTTNRKDLAPLQNNNDDQTKSQSSIVVVRLFIQSINHLPSS
ncbi:hypothetical protein ACTFIU_004519 [Dictyostelium citrinum]